MVGQLRDPEFRQAHLSADLLALLPVHVGKVARRLASSGMVGRQNVPEGAVLASGGDAGLRLGTGQIDICHTSTSSCISHPTINSGHRPVIKSTSVMNGADMRMESTLSSTPP